MTAELTDSTTPTAALDLESVSVVRDGRTLVADVTWRVDSGQRWVLLGANGSGKTSLVRIAALYDHPSSGRVSVLGQTLGRCDVRRLRRRIGVVSAAFSDLVRPDLAAADVVMCALNASLEPWWHSYDDDDRAAARDALGQLDIGHLASRRFGSLSSGERQRVQLARALITRAELLLLDEPTAGLDLAGREEFIANLDAIGPDGPPMVLVTHHLEEIPAGFTHALLLGKPPPGGSSVLGSGPIDRTLTSELVSRCVGIDVTVQRQTGRWSARR